VLRLLEDREKSLDTFMQEATSMLTSLFRYRGNDQWLYKGQF
jgi:hypothetical protein